MTLAAAPALPHTTQAALAWSTGALFFLYAFMQRVAPSVMVDDLMREFSVGAAAVGNISAFYFYAYVALQLPVGALMDRVGPRRLMSGAAAVAALGSILFAASGGLAGASAGRLLVGLGCAFSWVGVLVLATQLFPPGRFALLAGLGQAAGMLGGILGQAPLGKLVASWGWRPTALALGLLGLAIAAGIWLMARDQPAPAGERPPLLAGLKRVARRGQSWLAAVVALSLTATMLGFAGLWAVPFFMLRYGMEKADAAALASLCFVGWMVGAPLMGWLSDRIGRRKPLMIAGCVTMTLVTTIVIYAPGLPWWAAAALFIPGSAFAATMVLTFAVARDHGAPEDSGAAYGFVNTATVGSGALFQPLLGLVLDAVWDGAMAGGARAYSLEAYRTAFLVLPAVGLAGLAAALFIREPAARR